MTNNNVKILELAIALARARGELGTLIWSYETSDEGADTLSEELLQIVQTMFNKSLRNSDPFVSLVLDASKTAISDLTYFYEMYEPSDEYEDDDDDEDSETIKAQEQLEWLESVHEFFGNIKDGYTEIPLLDMLKNVFSLSEANSAFEVEHQSEGYPYVSNVAEVISKITEFSEKNDVTYKDPLFAFLMNKTAESIHHLSVYSQSYELSEEELVAIDALTGKVK